MKVMNETRNEKHKSTGISLPRLGFLGAGWIGKHRMECIAASGMADVAYICDSSPTAIAAIVQANPGIKIASSFGELLEAELDGIVIATPSALHAEQTIRALENGMAVFCQKPLGRNAAEVAGIVHAAETGNRLLGVDLSYRFTAGMQQIRSIIASGSIGEVYACDLVFHNAYGPDKAWFYDSELSGGGSVMDLGVHLVDLVLWALDFPTVKHVTSSLFAAGKPLKKNSRQVEDFGIATIEFASGAVARLACSWKLAVGCDAIISATFHGSNGGLAFHNVNGSFYDFVAERFDGTSRTTLVGPPDAWGGRAAVAWATQLKQNSAFDPEICHAIEVSAILDSIYERRQMGVMEWDAKMIENSHI
jgi:predicted dehydrogenase